MNIDNMVFRSVYVDPDVDRMVLDQAAQLGISKGEMFRRYLVRGMELADAGHAPAPLPREEPRLCMRTVYLPVKVDESLRGQAYHLRTSKSDLIRQYLRSGMDALQASVTRAAKPVRGKRASGKTTSAAASTRKA